ncbi:unnamed protein product [Natator depressus]
MLLLLLLPMAVLRPLGAPAGHIAPMLSTRKANRQDRSRPRIQVYRKSHHQACTNGLCAKAKDFLLQVDPGTDTAFVTPASSFAEFMEKHVDNPKTTNTYNQTYCNYVMKERNMICKQKITFIHAHIPDIKDICGHRATRYQDYYFESKQRFSLTECHRQTQRPPAL